MTKQPKKIAFIGLGKMGSALAKRLLPHFDLTVYNRTAAKMQPIVAAGAKGATSIKDAVKNADVVITSLLDDDSLLQVVLGNDGFLSTLKSRAIHIDTTTILPSTSKKLNKIHNENGTIYLAGNVLGVPKVAEKGELTSLVAGDEAAIECVAEIYTFAEKSGLDTEFPRNMFHTVFAHPAFKLYVDKIRERNFDDVNFSLSTGFKDLQLFQKAFTEERVVPDILNSINNKFIIALAHGMEEKDWSAITEITRQQAGLK